MPRMPAAPAPAPVLCRTYLATLLAGLVALAGVVTVTAGDAAGDPNPPATLEAVVSSADGTHRVESTEMPVTPLAATEPAMVTVDPTRARQHLYGVGASLTESSAHVLARLPDDVRADALGALFDPARGGLSVVRLVIGSSDFSSALVSLDDSEEPDPTLAKFSIDRDRAEIIPIARQILAINPEVTFIASSWSAPAWMKTPANFLFGRLRPEYEGVYADYLVRFLTAYRDAGIPVARISVQNEPAAIKLDMPSMIMDADQEARLVHELGPRLTAAGLATRVLVWDHNWCSAAPPGGCVGPEPPQGALDVLAATDGAYPVAGTALHCYEGSQVAANRGLHDAWPDLEIWQTECSGGAWQGARANAFENVALSTVQDRAHWASATLLWNLALDPSGGPHTGGCRDCRGVLTVDPDAGTWTANVDLDVLATVARHGPAGSGALQTDVTGPPHPVVAAGVCSPERRASVLLWNPGAAKDVTVRIGTFGFVVSVPTETLLSLRAPAEMDCARSTPAGFDGPANEPEPPDESTTTTVSEVEPSPGAEPPLPLTEPTGPRPGVPGADRGEPTVDEPVPPEASPTRATPTATPARPVRAAARYTG